MTETEIDLEALRAAIREQAARRRADLAAAGPLTVPAPAPWTFNWLEARRRLHIATGMAHIAAPPQLANRRGLRRRLASWTARLVIRLTRFMSNRQIDYNVCLLETIHDMAEALHEVETRAIANQDQIRQLEATLAQLQTRAGLPPDEPARKAG